MPDSPVRSSLPPTHTMITLSTSQPHQIGNFQILFIWAINLKCKMIPSNYKTL